jgi:hypothetical protein
MRRNVLLRSLRLNTSTHNEQIERRLRRPERLLLERVHRQVASLGQADRQTVVHGLAGGGDVVKVLARVGGGERLVERLVEGYLVAGAVEEVPAGEGGVVLDAAVPKSKECF